MQEYGFSLTCFPLYKDKDSFSPVVFIRENTDQWKPVFSHILCKFDGQRFYGREYKTFAICHMSSRDQVRKMSFNLLGWNLPPLVTTLQSLLVIGFVEEELEHL